jgi:hypothetical protein
MGVTLSYSGLGGKVKFSGTSGRFKTTYTRPGLLDVYPSAAAAYSLRKLSNTYTGSAIRVRRSSDNTETDIGFVSGQLDTASLLTFCGAGNGFVTTWYDQSVNANHLIQTTTTSQPNIVVSGVITTRSGKPYIVFPAGTTKLILTTTLTTLVNESFSFWMTYEKAAVDIAAVLANSANNSYHWLDYLTTQYINGANNTIVITNLAANSLGLINIITNYSVGATMYRNGVSIGTRGALTGGSVTNILLTGLHPQITLSEFIFYPTNQEANRTAITSDINSYYTIY